MHESEAQPHLAAYEKLLERHGTWASKWPGRGRDRASFIHLQARMHALQHGSGAMRRAIACAREALDRLPRHSGVRHHYAELVAAVVERGDIPRGETGARLREALSLAGESVTDEIRSFRKPYPKFYATLGRLEALRPDFDNARDNLLKAIEHETGSYESEARRTDYKLMLADIAHRRRLLRQEQDFRTRLEGEVERMRRNTEETKTRHAEMLGFFAGVRALVLTGLSIKGRAAAGRRPTPRRRSC
jgi:hypothetical protein